MNKMLHEHRVGAPRFAHLVLAFLIAACSADDSKSRGAGDAQTPQPFGGQAASSATNAGAGGTSSGGVTGTVELIGPGTARCGATNATHGDGFVCVLNYPSEGPNVVGYWFDYAFAPGTCNVGFTKPPGNDAA